MGGTQGQSVAISIILIVGKWQGGERLVFLDGRHGQISQGREQREILPREASIQRTPIEIDPDHFITQHFDHGHSVDKIDRAITITAIVGIDDLVRTQPQQDSTSGAQLLLGQSVGGIEIPIPSHIGGRELASCRGTASIDGDHHSGSGRTHGNGRASERRDMAAAHHVASHTEQGLFKPRSADGADHGCYISRDKIDPGVRRKESQFHKPPPAILMAMCSGEFKTVYAMLTNAFNLSAREVSTLITRRLVVAISGASGVIYGVRTLQRLRELGIETHLVMTRAAKITLSHETDLKVSDVEALASVVHPAEDVGASISSGSFRTLGMIVAPCSIRSLSEIASGVTTGLLSRAADVALKERRRLVLLVREAPLHAGHLKSMLAATEMGAIIMPPVPAFYFRPNSLDAVIDQTIGRSLDLFDLEAPGTQRWEGSR